MFKPDRSTDRQLFAFSVAELVPDDSDVWLYVDLFDQLDLAAFDDDYSSQGGDAHEPRLVLRTIFYGLTHGISSGRKLEDACVFDARYAVLSGGNRPSYRSFTRFVRRHESKLDGLFVQVVRVAQGAGLVALGRIAIDGSKFKAKTSKHKAMSKGRMDQAIQEIRDELARLKAEAKRANAEQENADRLEGEIRFRETRLARIQAAKAALEAEAQGAPVEASKQKSFNDHDALPMAKTSAGFQYGYNCQAAVDEKSQIVVAAVVHDNVADQGALSSVMDAVVETCGAAPGAVLADAGYFSYENLAKIHAHGAEPFVARGKGEQLRKGISPHEVRFHPASAQYRCRRGFALRDFGRSSRMQGLAMTQGQCRLCARRKTCAIAARNGKTFWIPFGAQRVAALAHERLMTRPDSAATYRRRKVIVEPVFGNIKNKGIKIQVVGRKRVAAWWKLATTAHNIEKIIGSRR